MDRRKNFIIIVASLLGIIAVIALIWGVYSQSAAYKANRNTGTVIESKEIAGNNGQASIEEDKIDNDKNTSIQEVEVLTLEPDQEVLEEDIRTFLLLGIDRTDERDAFFSVYRSDSIALLRLDMNSNWAKVLSIPRDTYTYLPVTDQYDKINHAYAFGSLNGRGEASVLEAVNIFIGEETTKKYFALEMEPIPEIVDSIGGIEIDVEIDIKSHGADINKGLQVLNGEDAYDYVHWRYSGNGDIGRIARQQKFVTAMLKQVPQKYDNTELAKLLIENADYYNTNIHTSELTDILKVLTSVDEVEYSVIKGEGQTIEGISYWVPDEALNKQVIEEFLNTPNID